MLLVIILTFLIEDLLKSNHYNFYINKKYILYFISFIRTVFYYILLFLFKN